MIVEEKVTINGSREAVWKAITDIENAATIVRGIERIEIVERPSSGIVGLRWLETRILFGNPATVEKRITDAIENVSYKTEAHDGGFVFVTEAVISENNGEIVLSSSHDSRPQGFLSKLKAMPMIFFKGMITKAILEDLNDFKMAVENDR